MNKDNHSPRTRRGTTVGTEDQFRWLRVVVWFIIVMNILDALFTLFWVNTGLAEEANVLLRFLVHNHPVLFIIAKFALVLTGTYILWRYRRNRYAVFGLFLAFIVYYALLLHHLGYFSYVVSRHFTGP
ncbi:MAG: DUF5658 family protein [Gammaproteobacteria bacterium]|jgi:hypothetical protein